MLSLSLRFRRLSGLFVLLQKAFSWESLDKCLARGSPCDQPKFRRTNPI